MLSKLEITLTLGKHTHLNQNISSLMQGVLMEKLNREYAEKLHFSTLKPYSQYILFRDDIAKWVILGLEEDAEKEILEVLANDKISFVYLNYKNIVLDITEKKLQLLSYDRLLENTFFSYCQRKVIIEFVSPTAFKSDGKYLFYPSLKHILKSLMNKFDTYCKTTSIYSEELLIDFENNIQIIDYKLKSTKFHLEGISIPSFLGRITLKINGPQQLVNTAHMLLKYGEYSGVGIKCAMGMGAIRVLERGNQKYERK